MKKDMKKIEKVAMDSVASLIMKGHSPKKAEDMVLEILKECMTKGAYEIGGASMVIATLRMIFLDVSVTDASKSFADDLLKF